MRVVNNLKFKDKREQAFSNGIIKSFVDSFIDEKVYEHIEIDKSAIYLYKIGESGFSHFDINAIINTAKEMIAYLSGLVSAKYLLLDR